MRIRSANMTRLHHSTVSAAPLAAALLLVVACATGCDSGGNGSIDNNKGFSRSDWDGFVRHGEIAGVPTVYVDRKGGEAKGYVYGLQGQRYEEIEILALMRALLKNTPDLEVHIIPSAVMTSDEIGLAEAKFREAGVRRIVTANSGTTQN